MPQNFLDTKTTIIQPSTEVRTVVKAGALRELPEYLAQAGLNGRAFIITDANVNVGYCQAVCESLSNAGINTTVLEMAAGEEYKTLSTVSDFLEKLSAHNATRGDTIIAIGGGVVGDLGGFVAAIYNRGVPLVHVPTTLLAMVDSSIGGKTGVDHGGKNKTGAFYQPKLVVADPNVLSTLNQRVYTEGFGEIVKYGILDADFLPQLEALAPKLSKYSRDNLESLGQVIAHCVKQKTDTIASDPLEQNPGGRILLNYGHTLAHGLEAGGGYTELLHGEAVAIGMSFAAQLSTEMGIADPGLVTRQASLLKAFGLPTTYTGNATVSQIMDNIFKDKKNTIAGETRFVLPVKPGEMKVVVVGNATVKRFVEQFLV